MQERFVLHFNCKMERAFVYILHSISLKKYYVGFTTLTPEERLIRHLSDYYSKKKNLLNRPRIGLLFGNYLVKMLMKQEKLKLTLRR